MKSTSKSDRLEIVSMHNDGIDHDKIAEKYDIAKAQVEVIMSVHEKAESGNEAAIGFFK